MIGIVLVIGGEGLIATASSGRALGTRAGTTSMVGTATTMTIITGTGQATTTGTTMATGTDTMMTGMVRHIPVGQAGALAT